MAFIWCIHTSVQPPPLYCSRILSSTQKERQHPSNNTAPAPQQLTATHLRLQVCLFWTFHTNGIKKYIRSSVSGFVHSACFLGGAMLNQYFLLIAEYSACFLVSLCFDFRPDKLSDPFSSKIKPRIKKRKKSTKGLNFYYVTEFGYV